MSKRHAAVVASCVGLSFAMLAMGACTKGPELTVEAALQGPWEVWAIVANGRSMGVGTLDIDGDSYRFEVVPGAEVPTWMKERFRFLDEPSGTVHVEYEPGVSPGDDIRSFASNQTLARCTGVGKRETFLIRTGPEPGLLTFHADFSELQLYAIHRNHGAAVARSATPVSAGEGTVAGSGR